MDQAVSLRLSEQVCCGTPAARAAGGPVCLVSRGGVIRLAGFVLWCVMLGGCASLHGPSTIHVRDLPPRPVYSAEWITSDRAAAAIAMAVMERELGLPRLDVTLHFLPDRAAFREALVADGYTVAFAEQTADRVDAIAGYRRVYFNETSLARLTWPLRAGFYAHELTHTLQYELGGGVRGTSDQWLREGFADWVAARVLAAIEVMRLDDFRERRATAYRQGGTRPPLDRMATFPDWVALLTELDGAAVNAAAYLAVEFLVDRHGVEAVLDYFGRFAGSQDRLGHFAAAFGEPLPAFEAALTEHLHVTRGR